MRNRYEFLFVFSFIFLLLVQAFPLGQSLSTGFDSFPLRDAFISRVTEFRLWAGDRVFHDVLVGPNNWLVYATNPGMDKFQNVHPLTDAELEEYGNSLEDFQALTESTGAHLLFVAAPYKNTVYPEYVPPEIHRIGDTSRLDQILNYLAAHLSLQVLDLRPAMSQAKLTSQIYYSTDTHWNDLGGYAAYQAILDAVHPSFPELSPHPLSDFEIVVQPPKIMDLSFIMGDTSLAEERVQLQFLFKQSSRTDSMVLPSGRQINFSRNRNPDLPVALFFHDSFLYSVMPFLSEHFSAAYYVDMMAGNDMLPRAWVEQIDPDIVIIILNEHFLDILPQLLEKGRPDLD